MIIPVVLCPLILGALHPWLHPSFNAALHLHDYHVTISVERNLQGRKNLQVQIRKRRPNFDRSPGVSLQVVLEHGGNGGNSMQVTYINLNANKEQVASTGRRAPKNTMDSSVVQTHTHRVQEYKSLYVHPAAHGASKCRA